MTDTASAAPGTEADGADLIRTALRLREKARAAPAQNDESNPAAALLLADAQVCAILALVEQAADIAAELQIIRKYMGS